MDDRRPDDVPHADPFAASLRDTVRQTVDCVSLSAPGVGIADDPFEPDVDRAFDDYDVLPDAADRADRL